ncbi:MAG: hypothetical protein HY791_37525 [Deltaproteobacteria bacterium]|nr:hypothetical protein [Deltaproteobacteria bacterium]
MLVFEPQVTDSARTAVTREIRAPSAREEAVLVARVTVATVVAVVLTSKGPAKETAAALLPHQVLVQDVSKPDQRTYRALREGLLEAERLRSEAGDWPDPEQLASLGIPPFAPDPIDRDAYTWTKTTRDLVTNYLGSPASNDRSELLVLVQEPFDPKAPAPSNDEVHRALNDGTPIHVSIWLRKKRGSVRLVENPPAEGFVQILSQPLRNP